jgi:hypothetical protein
LAHGVYSATHRAGRVLFFTSPGDDCPTSPPDNVSESKNPGFYVLVWNGSKTGRICTCEFAERSDYETDSARVIAWISNIPTSTVGLNSKDRIISKTIINGNSGVTVGDFRKIRPGLAATYVSILKAENGSANELKPSVKDIAVFFVAPNLSETPLSLGEEAGEFVLEIPTFLQKRGFRVLVKVDNGGNTFLFPLFVPAYGEPPTKAK